MEESIGHLSHPFVVEEGIHAVDLAAVFLAVLNDRSPLIRVNAALVGSESRALIVGWARAEIAAGRRTGILRAEELPGLLERAHHATT